MPEQMLARMIGTTGDGPYDHLLDEQLRGRSARGDAGTLGPMRGQERARSGGPSAGLAYDA
mgnify:CR=1 FL=1